MCRVVEFRPLGGRIEGSEVKTFSKGVPYAAIEIEAPAFPEPAAAFITHKEDFQHLWYVFEVRGVADDEEVIVVWSKSALKGVARWFSRTMPGLLVWVCPKHAYELMHDRSFRPELDASERLQAASPIEKWEPAVLR